MENEEREEGTIAGDKTKRISNDSRLYQVVLMEVTGILILDGDREDSPSEPQIVI